MKTTRVESMEELVFENRNKEYGAYSLRKNYKNHILFAFLIVIFMVGSALTFPLMLTPDKIVAIPGDTIVITIDPIRPTEPEPLKPPPDPPASKVNIPPDLAYKVPKVVDEPIDNNGFGPPETVNPLPENLSTGPIDIDPNPSAGENEPIIQPAVKPEPLLVVQEMPHFPEGVEAMVIFIRNHLHYPTEARELNITGTVYLSFVVEPDGSLTEITVARPVGGGCEEEAIKVLKSMPNWIPGKQNGNTVRVRLSLPVRFTLQD